MNKKICINFDENEEIKEGDKILVKLPHEEIDREFIVKSLDKNFKNLPIIEYNGGELLLDPKVIIKKIK